MQRDFGPCPSIGASAGVARGWQSKCPWKPALCRPLPSWEKSTDAALCPLPSAEAARGGWVLRSGLGALAGFRSISAMPPAPLSFPPKRLLDDLLDLLSGWLGNTSCDSSSPGRERDRSRRRSRFQQSPAGRRGAFLVGGTEAAISLFLPAAPLIFLMSRYIFWSENHCTQWHPTPVKGTHCSPGFATQTLSLVIARENFQIFRKRWLFHFAYFLYFVCVYEYISKINYTCSIF